MTRDTLQAPPRAVLGLAAGLAAGLVVLAAGTLPSCGGAGRESGDAGASSPALPNVLFVLVDTLRADRLMPYGYERETSPSLAALADRGTVFEQAYAPAPWTLPSMVGLMTGRSPGAVSHGTPGSFALPDELPVLAEEMAARGYATAGFYGNPTLHAGNGFARGFDAFHTPPPEPASLRLHADSILDRAVPWLREQQERHPARPFFLYAHFLDPHDPYLNPANEEGRWPWLPAYTGPLGGDSIHGLYTGAVELADPQADVAWLSALYDGEVAYVDRAVGELLEALEPEVLANTLVVVTADHGEELHDHGGWKHGETLYQEQIRVPLILRWEAGPVPAGTRVAEPVSLLDLMPTVLAAAGGELPPGLEGIDLLSRLAAAQPLPRRALYARHFGRGPLRAGVLLPPYKLVLFNRAAPFEPTDEVEAHLWRLDLERLERVELFDLAADPHERRNLAAERPQVVARLAPEIHRRLDRELSGLRVVAAPDWRSGGTPTLTVHLELARAPSGWQSLFLGADDRVRREGRTVALELVPDAVAMAKGVLVEGDLGSVTALEVDVGGAPAAPGAVVLGDGRPYRGGLVDLASLETDIWPGRFADGEVLRLWTRRVRAVTEEDPETVRRLRNLGYVR